MLIAWLLLTSLAFWLAMINRGIVARLAFFTVALLLLKVMFLWNGVLWFGAPIILATFAVSALRETPESKERRLARFRAAREAQEDPEFLAFCGSSPEQETADMEDAFLADEP